MRRSWEGLIIARHIQPSAARASRVSSQVPVENELSERRSEECGVEMPKKVCHLHGKEEQEKLEKLSPLFHLLRSHHQRNDHHDHSDLRLRDSAAALQESAQAEYYIIECTVI